MDICEEKGKNYVHNWAGSCVRDVVGGTSGNLVILRIGQVTKCSMLTGIDRSISEKARGIGLTGKVARKGNREISDS